MLVDKKIKKFLWNLLLFADLLLFLFAILAQNLTSMVIVALVASVIYRKGNEVMFGDFDRKQKAKIEAIKIRRKEYQQARITSKK